MRSLSGQPTLDVVAAALMVRPAPPLLGSALAACARYGVEYERAFVHSTSITVRMFAAAALGVPSHVLRSATLALSTPLVALPERDWIEAFAAIAPTHVDHAQATMFADHLGIATTWSARPWGFERVEYAAAIAAETLLRWPQSSAVAFVELAALAAWNYQGFCGGRRAHIAFEDALRAIHPSY